MNFPTEPFDEDEFIGRLWYAVDRMERNFETQLDFASWLGISSQAISQWKTGQTKPSREIVNRIAAHSGLSADWIELGKGQKYLATGDSLIDRITRIMEKLPPDAQERVFSFARWEAAESTKDD